MAIILVFETTWQIDPNTTKSFYYTTPAHIYTERITTLGPILVNNHCQTLEYTMQQRDLGGH